MNVKLKREHDLLIIKTTNIQLEDLFYNYDSKLINNIKRNIFKAYVEGLRVRMDITSDSGNEVKYLINLKNPFMDYLSDIDFAIVE